MRRMIASRAIPLIALFAGGCGQLLPKSATSQRGGAASEAPQASSANDQASGSATPATTASIGQASLVVASPNELPACTAAQLSELAYVASQHQLFVCQGGTWVALALGTGANGSLLTRSVPEPAGANCKYSGTKVLSGIDVSGNRVLDDAEATSTIYICQDTIEQTAQAVFGAVVHSIGIVGVSVDEPANCTSTATIALPTTRRVFAAGTGWLLAPTVVMTNYHVLAKISVLDYCTAIGQAPTGTGTSTAPSPDLTLHVSVFFPKTTLAADTLLLAGLPNYTGFFNNSSMQDFDEFPVGAVDRSPASTTSPADMAFAQIAATTRAPLTISTLSAASPTASTMRSGDDVFHIGYDLVSGPRLATASVFQMQTCQDWDNVGSAGGNCVTDVHVAPSSTVMSFFGYGDHGGSGSPVFDRFGNVSGILTWGADATGETPFITAQVAVDIERMASLPRTWSAP